MIVWLIRVIYLLYYVMLEIPIIIGSRTPSLKHSKNLKDVTCLVIMIIITTNIIFGW